MELVSCRWPVVVLVAWVAVSPRPATAAPTAGARLIAAAKAADAATVIALAREPDAANATEADGTSALEWVVRGGDRRAVQALLDAGADVSHRNRYGVTALTLAVENGDVATVDMLLKAGADPNTALPEGETALMTAVRTGDVRVVQTLIAAGAALGAHEDFHGETALIWAAAANHADVVRALIAAGADVNERSRRDAFAKRTQGLTVLPLGSWTPLMYAAREGAMATASALVDAGADLNLVDPDGATALVLAIINLKFDVAAMLIERGANPNIADRTGMTPLYAAVDMNTITWTFGLPEPQASASVAAVDIVRQLLDHGADPNARLTSTIPQRLHTTGDEAIGAGSTAFMRAAKSGDVTVMRLLLAHGADPLATAKNGTTALMLASGLGWRDGNAAVPTRDRGTEAEAMAAIQLCLDLGLDINAKTDRGDTALHASVSGRGSDDIVRFLVAHGALLGATNNRGQTPLDVGIASRKDRSSTVAVLRQLMAEQQ
jgi:ankyrin repeat protein